MPIALAMQILFQSLDNKILHQISRWQSKASAIGLEHLIFYILLIVLELCAAPFF
jgi:cytochrome b561